MCWFVSERSAINASPVASDIVRDALELPAEQREAFILSMCAGEIGLQERVERLVEEATRATEHAAPSSRHQA
jgi:hypothetical protein